nr:tigger transposable element-derived protein 6-like [Danaus plexippus plexippus]
MPELSQIKLVYLPPNKTSKLQPMDQGIINNFKIYYRKEVLRHVIQSIEDNQCPQIDVLQAMRFARKAWFSVTKTTIANCFKKSGFKSEVTVAQSLQEEDENLETDPEDWNLAISNNQQQQQPTFEDFINVDDGPLMSHLTRFHCISAVKFKVAVTGARMLEVSGWGCKEKANSS